MQQPNQPAIPVGTSQSHQSAPSCCSVAEHSTCCTAENKPVCCGTALEAAESASQRCGCR